MWAGGHPSTARPRDIEHITWNTQQVLDLIGETAWRSRRRGEDPDLALFARAALR